MYRPTGVRRRPAMTPSSPPGRVDPVAELDVDGMLKRFRERAAAVKKRPLPPIEGDERKKFIEQSQLDFQDFAIVSDASWTLVDGVLTLTVDLRPPSD